jgi:hypothetical protein
MSDTPKQSIREEKYHFYDVNGKLIFTEPVKESELGDKKRQLNEQGVHFTVRQILLS